ncbi:unnamed protein product [Gadus morhua 'NCC']
MNPLLQQTPMEPATGLNRSALALLLREQGITSMWIVLFSASSNLHIGKQNSCHGNNERKAKPKAAWLWFPISSWTFISR